MVTDVSKTFNRPFLASTNIIASNDINEESLHSLSDQVNHVVTLRMLCETRSVSVLFTVTVAVDDSSLGFEDRFDAVDHKLE